MTENICGIGISSIFDTVFRYMPIFLRVLRYWVPTNAPLARRCSPMVGHLFQNYDTIYVRFFSHVYLQSFLLHDIRAFFCHVYLRFIPKYMTIFLQTRLYMRTKKPIYMRYKQACGIWCSFMYDGAEK